MPRSFSDLFTGNSAFFTGIVILQLKRCRTCMTVLGCYPGPVRVPVGVCGAVFGVGLGVSSGGCFSCTVPSYRVHANLGATRGAARAYNTLLLWLLLGDRCRLRCRLVLCARGATMAPRGLLSMPVPWGCAVLGGCWRGVVSYCVLCSLCCLCVALTSS